VSQLIDRRPAARKSARPVPTARPHVSPRGDSASPRPRDDHAQRADAEPHEDRDRGLSLLGVFTCAMLLIVGLASLTAVLGQMWILAPVMAIDLTVTGLVIATIARLLRDGDDR
jgi:hypothetical protein